MKNDSLMDAIGLADEKFIEEAALLNGKGIKKPKRRVWHRVIAFAACLCLLTVGTFSAYALSDDIRSFINMNFFKNNLRITEENIPEGYTPIYDAEGLDAIRNDLKGNYILMKDIRFTDADFAEGGRFAGGWEPIGNKKNAFRGIFNGNGYVIYGLRVNIKGNHGGLFGRVVQSPDVYSGVIKNLGVSGASISLHATADYGCYAGVIAGSAHIVAGCFVEKSEVTASYDVAERRYAHVGGLCGDVYIADSCYVNAKVSYKEVSSHVVESIYYPTAYVGAFAGSSFSVINSLCLGAAQYIGDPIGEVIISDMVANNYFVPRCMNGGAFLDIVEAGNNDFSARQFEYKYIGYYVAYPEDYILYTYDPDRVAQAKKIYELFSEISEAKKNERENGIPIPDEIVEKEKLLMEILKDLPDKDRWYCLTENIDPRELEVMSAYILSLMTVDEWRSILIKNGMKVGIIDCYTSRQGEYTGFDMEKIWRDDKSGIPKLRIFD
ncbi:MAG: hypothetical protein IJN63_00490 [Clostridia bacterium]|nr:hypothetical protein [Clostridia bacterium]